MSAKTSAKRPARGKERGTLPKKRRTRGSGPFSLTVPAAGKMVGLSRTGSYRAAHAGQIPTIEVGRGMVVPRLLWERMLGIQTAPKPNRQLNEENAEIA
jgi:hypothetical protein